MPAACVPQVNPPPASTYLLFAEIWLSRALLKLGIVPACYATQYYTQVFVQVY